MPRNDPQKTASKIPLKAAKKLLFILLPIILTPTSQTLVASCYVKNCEICDPTKSKQFCQKCAPGFTKTIEVDKESEKVFNKCINDDFEYYKNLAFTILVSMVAGFVIWVGFVHCFINDPKTVKAEKLRLRYLRDKRVRRNEVHLSKLPVKCRGRKRRRRKLCLAIFDEEKNYQRRVGRRVEKEKERESERERPKEKEEEYEEKRKTEKEKSKINQLSALKHIPESLSRNSEKRMEALDLPKPVCIPLPKKKLTRGSSEDRSNDSPSIESQSFKDFKPIRVHSGQPSQRELVDTQPKNYLMMNSMFNQPEDTPAKSNISPPNQRQGKQKKNSPQENINNPYTRDEEDQSNSGRYRLKSLNDLVLPPFMSLSSKTDLPKLRGNKPKIGVVSIPPKAESIEELDQESMGNMEDEGNNNLTGFSLGVQESKGPEVLMKSSLMAKPFKRGRFVKKRGSDGDTPTASMLLNGEDQPEEKESFFDENSDPNKRKETVEPKDEGKTGIRIESERVDSRRRNFGIELKRKKQGHSPLKGVFADTGRKRKFENQGTRLVERKPLYVGSQSKNQLRVRNRLPVYQAGQRPSLTQNIFHTHNGAYPVYSQMRPPSVTQHHYHPYRNRRLVHESPRQTFSPKFVIYSDSRQNNSTPRKIENRFSFGKKIHNLVNSTSKKTVRRISFEDSLRKNKIPKNIHQMNMITPAIKKIAQPPQQQIMNSQFQKVKVASFGNLEQQEKSQKESQAQELVKTPEELFSKSLKKSSKATDQNDSFNPYYNPLEHSKKPNPPKQNTNKNLLAPNQAHSTLVSDSQDPNKYYNVYLKESGSKRKNSNKSQNSQNSQKLRNYTVPSAQTESRDSKVRRERNSNRIVGSISNKLSSRVSMPVDQNLTIRPSNGNQLLDSIQL
jgi:hypothetical protein